jgi:hypothetical protein
MQYEVYRNKNATDAEVEAMDKFFKQVENEDKELCNGAQVNLNVGAYSFGELQPFHEKGVLYFQRLLRDAVMEHREKEQEAKEEIWPARLTTAGSSDVKFCQDLEACTVGSPQLAW